MSRSLDSHECNQELIQDDREKLTFNNKISRQNLNPLASEVEVEKLKNWVKNEESLRRDFSVWQFDLFPIRLICCPENFRPKYFTIGTSESWTRLLSLIEKWDPIKPPTWLNLDKLDWVEEVQSDRRLTRKELLILFFRPLKDSEWRRASLFQSWGFSELEWLNLT